MSHRSDSTRSGLTVAETLVALASLLVVICIVAPVLTRTRCINTAGIRCANHLKQIYGYAVAYSDKSKTRHFPIAPGESPCAHESLNEPIGFDRDGLSPKMFVCPTSDPTPAVPDADGRFVLSGATSSYAWTAKPLKEAQPGAPRPLASDKYVDGFEDASGRHSGHKGGMNVLYTDGSVRFVPEKDLDPVTRLPPGLTR